MFSFVNDRYGPGRVLTRRGVGQRPRPPPGRGTGVTGTPSPADGAPQAAQSPLPLWSPLSWPAFSVGTFSSKASLSLTLLSPWPHVTESLQSCPANGPGMCFF